MFLPISALAEVVTVDFVRVLNGNTEEAVFYYENNWKQHRIKAVKKGFISSFKLLLKTSDDGQTDILLITGYASESQYENREKNFARIMSDTGRDGPVMMNDKPPSAFREISDKGIYTSD
jgi:hypothetical protein